MKTSLAFFSVIEAACDAILTTGSPHSTLTIQLQVLSEFNPLPVRTAGVFASATVTFLVPHWDVFYQQAATARSSDAKSVDFGV